jgi:hypothetical protein
VANLAASPPCFDDADLHGGRCIGAEPNEHVVARSSQFRILQWSVPLRAGSRGRSLPQRRKMIPRPDHDPVP